MTIVRSLRDDARGRLLLAQVVEQVARGQLVEVVVLLQRLDVLLDRPAREGADRLAELARPARPSRRARTGRRPARPGAGVTITRSRVMSSIRQVEAPSRNVWPGRAS